MKSFFRSLIYLKPYRKRLILSAVFVVFIATLWGGGLGMLLPGMKILIAPEGLHGWAWNSLYESKLNAKLVRRQVSPSMQKQYNLPATVVQVVRVNKKGAAQDAGLNANEWIVGVATATGTLAPADYKPAEDMLRTLAVTIPPDQATSLYIFNPEAVKPANAFRPLSITPAEPATSAQLLGEIATRIPEPQTREERFPLLVYLLVIVAAMTILRNLLRFFQEYLVQTAVFQSMIDLRCDNYNVALRLPVSFFAKEGVTDTMSRFVQDTSELGRAQNTLFGKTLVEPAKMIASVTMALLISWELTLIAMVGGPVVFVLIRKFGKIMKRSSKRALESWSHMLAILEETLTGIRVVKAYTMEAAERKRFFRVNRALYKSQRRMARTNSATSPAVEALGMLAGGGAAGGAGYLVFNGMMDPDMFLAWMACLAAMFDPMRKLSKVATRFQRGDAAAERVFELLDREVEHRVPSAPMLPRHKTDIVFDNVEFTYPGVEAPMLKNINLTVKAGQTIAVVGPNGSGKTTLMSLLPRLLDTSKGQIRIDGCDIATHSLRALRRQIAIVTQESVIFNATIAENISYGLRRPHPEQILDAAQKAYVDDFVREMPEAYETEVGQHGATLSGGQRQRIAIARAILRDPAILIFDEALSQIDADSEQKIHAAMHEFIRGRTTFMIAHRFQTILEADAIVVMDAGRIIDVGPHAELLERCELYRLLYQTQFRNHD